MLSDTSRMDWAGKYTEGYMEPDLVVPVVELLGTGLAAEVPGHPAELPCHAPLAELVTVVAADALKTQTLDEILLE